MAIDLNELATSIGQLILRFRLRRRTADDWTATNEVLLSAELGLETATDTSKSKIKIGDGVSPWNVLKYWGGGGATELTDLNAGEGIEITQFQPTTGGTGGDFADDANFSDVAVLTHFDSLDTNNKAIDSGPLGGIISPVGSAALSNAQLMFGDNSTAGDTATTSFLAVLSGWAVPDNTKFDWGAGDFTVEGWFYSDGNRSSDILMLFNKMNGDTGFNPGFRLSDDGGGEIIAYIPCTDSTTVVGRYIANFRSSGSPGINVWSHIALVRNGTQVRLYVDGVETSAYDGAVATTPGMVGATIGTKTVKHGTDPFNIGMTAQSGAVTYSWRGYIDEVRVTKMARYTSNFTAPSAQFPGYATPVVNVGNPYPIITNIRSGIVLTGAVATYGDLPTGLSSGDAGNAYLNWGDDLVYVWSGTAWPADGSGVSVGAGGGATDAGELLVHPDLPTALSGQTVAMIDNLKSGLTGWTIVNGNTTGSQTFTASGGGVLAESVGATAEYRNVGLQSISEMSVGDAYFVRVRFSSWNLVSYNVSGVALSDSNTFGSGNQVYGNVIFYHAGASRIDVLTEAATNFNSHTTFSTDAFFLWMSDVWVRLVMTAANTYRTDVSEDGRIWYPSATTTSSATMAYAGFQCGVTSGSGAAIYSVISDFGKMTGVS